MEESTKNVIKIVATVLCLAVAVLVFVKNSKRGPRGLSSIPAGDVVWVKCKDPQCGAEYQMNKRTFFKLVEERAARMANVPASAPPVACDVCGNETAVRAVECPKCGHVFFYGAKPADYPDRCPKCKHSETETNQAEQARL